MKIEDRIEVLEEQVGRFVDRTTWLERRAFAIYVRVENLEITLKHFTKDKPSLLKNEDCGHERNNDELHTYGHATYSNLGDKFCRDCGDPLQE